MKRSQRIALTLLASVSLTATGCSQQQPTQREVYLSKENCAQDWGSEANCEPSSTGTAFWGPNYYYRGGYPYYFPKDRDEPVPVDRNAQFSRVAPGAKSPLSAGTLATTHIARGGFGRGSASHGGSARG